MTSFSPQSNPPLFFVINGGSGRDDLDATLESIRAAMHGAGRKFEIFVLDNAAGIDATIKRAVDAALKDLLRGVPVPVQVGWVNDRIFLVNASVGLYPELLEDREQFKKRYGRSRLVALWSAIITAFGEHRQLDMVLEEGGKEVRLRAATLFVGNNRLQLEQVGMPQAALLNRGTLAAIAVNPVSTLALLGLAARGAVGRLADADNVRSFSFRSLTVTPLGLWRGMRSAWQARMGANVKRGRQRAIKVAGDGEIIWLHAPLTFRVGDEPLMLMKPEPEVAASGGAGNSIQADA